MKSYISRKFPLETRTTDQTLAFRSEGVVMGSICLRNHLHTIFHESEPPQASSRMLRFMRMNFRNRTPPSATFDRNASLGTPTCHLPDSKILVLPGVFYFGPSLISTPSFVSSPLLPFP